MHPHTCGDDQVKLGKPGTRKEVQKSAYERVVSPTLGEYPIEYTHTYNAMCIRKRLVTLLGKMNKYHAQKVKVYTKADLCEVLHKYTRQSKADTIFPFAEDNVFGLSIPSMRDALEVLEQLDSNSDDWIYIKLI